MFPGSTSVYIILAAVCVLILTLIGVAVWLFIQWRKKKQATQKDYKPIKIKNGKDGTAIITPPDFEVPFTFRPTRVQTPIRLEEYGRKGSSQFPEVSGRKVASAGIKTRAESLLDSYSEADVSIIIMNWICRMIHFFGMLQL